MKLKNLLFILTTFFIVQNTQAATIYVTTTEDVLSIFDNKCSLREAIYNANNDSSQFECERGNGADTIILTGGETYVLDRESTASADDIYYNDLDVTDQLTITSSNSDRAIIEANFTNHNEDTRILEAENVSLILKSLTFTGGYPASTTTLRGGNVYFHQNTSSETLTIQNCSFENATLEATGGSTPNLLGSGLAVEGTYTYPVTLTIDNSEFTNNKMLSHATQQSLLYGYGLYGASLQNSSINNSSFSYNTSATNTSANASDHLTYGGGVSLYYSDVDFTNTQIHANSFLYAQAAGAGIYSFNSNVTFTNSSITNNESPDRPASPGGISCEGTSSSIATLEITNSTISGNTGSRFGGLLASYCDTKLSHSTIYNNTISTTSNYSARSAGVSFSSSQVQVINSIIANNLDANNVSVDCNDYSGSATVTTYGTNFIEDASQCTLTPDSSSQNPDILGESLTLAELTNNGGNTLTHAFTSSDNDLIDGGTCLDVDGNAVGTDQVGTSRSTNCDIGAFEQVFYADLDGDGYTDPYNSTTTPTENYSLGNTDDDCDDNEANAHPGRTEICDDEIDNDCDGQEDENDPEGCVDPSSSGSGGSGSSRGSSSGDSNTSSGSSNNNTTCDANSENCDSEANTDTNASTGSGGCQLNSQTTATFPIATLGIIFLLLILFRKKQTS